MTVDVIACFPCEPSQSWSTPYHREYGNAEEVKSLLSAWLLCLFVFSSLWWVFLTIVNVNLLKYKGTERGK